MSKVKVLLVDDDEDDHFLVADLISDVKHGNYELEWARTYEEGIEKLLQGRHDVYLVDYRLGGKTGLDLLRFYKNTTFTAPFIILTGKGDYKIDLDAMSLGASDYLVKGTLSADILERALRYSIEKARATRLLFEQEAKYKTLFQKSLDAIFITTKDQYFEDINDSFIDLFGDHENIREYHVSDIFSSIDEYNTYEEKITKYGLVKDLEAKLRGPNGTIVQAVISAVGIHNAENEVEGYQGIIRDVTQLKNAENELSKVEKLAILGKFVRTIAHEVRNPLTNITLSLDQLLSEKPGDEDVEMYVGIAKRGTDRIERLINEMLKSTKPTELDFGVGHLHEVVEAALTITLDRFNLRQVKLKKNIVPMPPMQLDADKLQMAFVNIIINAIEAMDKQDKTFEVNMDHRDGQYVVTFTDNGCGISQEMLDNLFDAFYTGKTKGMGLGLNTVKQVIKGHKGNIKVQSELGMGTSFIISLKP
ncbi:hypothetical protein BH09BAC1_BH09BAC1_03220 [soil metagenome]